MIGTRFKRKLKKYQQNMAKLWWCPNGCGKTAYHTRRIIKPKKSRANRYFYCPKCKRGFSKKQMLELYNGERKGR